MALKSPQSALNRRDHFWASSDNGSRCRYSSSSSLSFFCLLPSFSHELKIRGMSRIMAAAKKEDKNSNRKKKEDKHSFFARPDEATGPYPEAVLLKKRTVEENGRLVPEFADAEERELFEALTLQLESDMDVDQMRHYEVLYLIHEDHKDEVENVNTKVQAFLKEKKGRVWRFSDWGMRRLAYSIQKADNAHYILMNIELDAKWINDFKSLLDKDERVIRYLVMKKDKAETKECPPPPEFHSLRGEMDYDDDEEYDDDDDGDDDDDEEEEEYDEEDDGEEEGEEGEEEEEEEEEGIIYVDDDASEALMSEQ